MGLASHHAAALAMLLPLAAALAQPDPGKDLNAWLAEKSQKRVQASFELRQRLEDRTGPVFGRDRDLAADFVRFRAGLTVKPVSWIKISALAQDARAPGYGASPPPGNVTDPLDLQEAYVELVSPSQTGLGFIAGRQMIGYGDTRLIGSPQWAYTARTWDTARLYYATKNARFELLHISPIVPRGDAFNKPILGDRIYGVYNTVRNVLGKNATDFYLLRHQQNRPGGFTGVGRYEVNVFGQRWAIPLPHDFRISAEGALQTGRNGRQQHRAGAGVVQVGRKLTFHGKALDLANEYKYASGTDPAKGRSGTFDQLYPAAHDKLGHVDLIGWRNIHNIRSISTLSLRKNWQWVLMYNSSWLANTRDSLYNAQGRAIVRSAAGTAGRYVGQEVDLYSNYTRAGYTIAAGVGQFIPGTFVKNTTPGAFSRLLYLSTSYSF